MKLYLEQTHVRTLLRFCPFGKTNSQTKIDHSKNGTKKTNRIQLIATKFFCEQ